MRSWQADLGADNEKNRPLTFRLHAHTYKSTCRESFSTARIKPIRLLYRTRHKTDIFFFFFTLRYLMSHLVFVSSQRARAEARRRHKTGLERRIPDDLIWQCGGCSNALELSHGNRPGLSDYCRCQGGRVSPGNRLPVLNAQPY